MYHISNIFTAMKLSYIFLLLCCLGLTKLMAQKNYAEFVQQNLTDDKIEITYKVPPNYNYIVSLETGDENIIARNVTGVGEVFGSPYMSVIWYYAEDGFDRVQIEPLKLRIVALSIEKIGNSSSKGGAKPPRGPRPSSGKGLSFAGLGMIGAGAGLGIFGYLQFAEGQSLYEDYKDNIDLESSFYTSSNPEQERNELFESANDKYTQGQILMYAGGGLAVIGGVLMVISGRQNGNASRVQLQPWENLAQVPIKEAPLGMGLKLRF